MFFILCIFLHIIYVQENVRRIRRRTLFPLYFLYSVVETAAALQALFPGLWLSLFLWRKNKKKKKKEWRVSVSKKKRYFSRFNFCYLVCRSIKCDFGKARLPKIFTRNFRQEKCWFYYGQLITQRPQKVHTFMRHCGELH